MIFDLDQCTDAVAPWDLVIRRKGVAFPTRRPDLGALAVLLNVKSMPKGQIVATTEKIFAPEAPMRDDWTMEELNAAVAAYVSYFSQSATKNFQSIGVKVAAAMGTQIPPTPPTSSPTGS